MIDRTGARDVGQDRTWAVLTGTVVGSLSTVLGLVLLVAAWIEGSSAADFALEIGVAVALSGLIWLCSSVIRGETISGRVDVSALAVMVVLGASGVIFALLNGKSAREALLTSGAAMFTLWIFCSFERWYVLRDDAESAGVRILNLALAIVFFPVYLWIVRPVNQAVEAMGALLRHDDPEVELNVDALTDDAELFAQLSAWDSDSPYRDPETMRYEFDTSAADVSSHIGQKLPDALVAWVDQWAGRKVRVSDEMLLTTWRWPAILKHPVELPRDVLIFAEEVRIGLAPGPRRFVIGIDLRPGPLYGSVIRGQLQPGRPPVWPVADLRVIAVSAERWAASINPGSGN